MKRHLPNLAGALLGLPFIAFGLMFLLGMMPEQEPPAEGSPPALFMSAVFSTGFMTFVKVCELIGGILVAIPRTRNLGLLVLGPILINILAYHAFIMSGKGLFNPLLLGIGALAVYLLWAERKAFCGLVCRPKACAPHAD